ncbi:TetR/AcrR family transcriptional regulator [Allokutzneria sp. NRRL B-24872]|uniref:TetR/AcrR family transcriptional regulator n=1 Tax=Allokutzneria sp. NRRL B-24872 TaxID=1137961 RepID=UPI000A37C935|nr:TetR/AcrR family transcriptional regulator [Allokutzneria sp. NRRL B-24872]
MTEAQQRHYGGRSAEDRRAERRERLMAAGLELFGTEGYSAISIERLCSAASVSTRNFYEEFPSRESLLIALHDRVLDNALRAVVAAAEETGRDATTLIRITALIKAYVGTTASDPRWARLSYVEIIGVSPAVEQHRMAWRRRWWALIEAEAARAVERGEAKPRDFHLTAVAFIGAVNELVHYWSVCGAQRPLSEVTDELLRLAITSLTADRG